ncbi:hypothetical protein HHK36_023382 [Tetracentron sinense]|uniref:Uncharacterized protein n=1 Tax=Tetracentron sinense TaxID=13715 RepID=A0A835D7V3_TETSI|nr:hypothetical protein HHK36_023382 [Tetracentron sinense]
MLKNTLSPLKDYYISNAHVRTIEPRFSLNPIILSTWNEFTSNEAETIFSMVDTKPIIVVTRARVSNFNGISLSTRGSTTITINPEIPEAISLQTWSHEHNDVLNELREKITHIPMPNASTTININEVLESTEMINLQQNSGIWDVVYAKKERQKNMKKKSHVLVQPKRQQHNQGDVSNDSSVNTEHLLEGAIGSNDSSVNTEHMLEGAIGISDHCR